MTSTATSTTTRATTAISTRATTASPRRAPRKGPPADWGAHAIALLLGTTAFLFGGSYPLSLVPPALLCAALLILYRPWTAASDSRWLEGWALVAVAAISFQLLPLPAPVIDRLSPAARQAWQAISLSTVDGPLPISIDLSSTAWALGVFAGSLAVFLVSRYVFTFGGVRVVARGVATIGLVLSAICLAQDATGHGLIYWRWPPPFQVAPPFGPFLNRNHFATWAVMAVPLALGYLLAHGSAHAHHPHPRLGWHQLVLQLMDERSIWLTASVVLMLVALVVSQSRAGMAGMAVALVLLAYLRQRAQHAPVSRWAVAALALAAIAAVIRSNPVDLYHRFGAVGVAAADRASIWRATIPVIRDFWLTGSGAGTFETAMLVYQRTPSLFRINAAHNHYLQVAAEGGLLVGIPVACGLVCFAGAAARALARDRSGMYLLRVGAMSGLAGVAVQSVWETGLATPANAVLAAVLAAIVLHHSTHVVRPGE